MAESTAGCVKGRLVLQQCLSARLQVHPATETDEARFVEVMCLGLGSSHCKFSEFLNYSNLVVVLVVQVSQSVNMFMEYSVVHWVYHMINRGTCRFPGVDVPAHSKIL